MNANKPKIGLRPIIDGRRQGIRESLEEFALQLTRKVADFISSSLRYLDGSPVECVVPEYCIGGAAEAFAVRQLFLKEGVCATLSITPSWCYPLETIDDLPVPKAIWGFHGTERPGIVYMAAALAAHNYKGDPAFGIYGRDVQDIGSLEIPPDVGEKILRFCRASIALSTMRGKAYLNIGTVSMGIAGSAVDLSFFTHYLGMNVEYIDMIEMLRRIEKGIFDHDEYSRALAWTLERCASREGMDPNPDHLKLNEQEKRKIWEFVVKMTLVARDLMVGNPKLAEIGYGEEAMGHNAIAAGFQGQRQWTDYLPNGDFTEAILCSSFDWNGIRPPFVFATENDSLNAATMLMGQLLTGTAQIFADVRTYWSTESVKRVAGYTLEGLAENGIIHLTNSGAAALDGTGQMKDESGNPVIKPFWEITDEDVESCISAVEWCPALREYFRGGGFSSKFTTKGGMPMTMARVNILAGIGPVLQIAEGYSVDLPTNVEAILSNRTNPTWPATWFVPKPGGCGRLADAFSVFQNWGANHCVISYGHIGADLITLASMLRIPVGMHNVEKQAIFRPSSWSLLGEPSSYQNDLLMCQHYGPLYR
jgi:L-fucose isomerase